MKIASFVKERYSEARSIVYGPLDRYVENAAAGALVSVNMRNTSDRDININDILYDPQNEPPKKVLRFTA